MKYLFLLFLLSCARPVTPVFTHQSSEGYNMMRVPENAWNSGDSPNTDTAHMLLRIPYQTLGSDNKWHYAVGNQKESRFPIDTTFHFDGGNHWYIVQGNDTIRYTNDGGIFDPVNAMAWIDTGGKNVSGEELKKFKDIPEPIDHTWQGSLNWPTNPIQHASQPNWGSFIKPHPDTIQGKLLYSGDNDIVPYIIRGYFLRWVGTFVDSKPDPQYFNEDKIKIITGHVWGCQEFQWKPVFSKKITYTHWTGKLPAWSGNGIDSIIITSGSYTPAINHGKIPIGYEVGDLGDGPATIRKGNSNIDYGPLTRLPLKKIYDTCYVPGPSSLTNMIITQRGYEDLIRPKMKRCNIVLKYDEDDRAYFPDGCEATQDKNGYYHKLPKGIYSK